MTETTATTRITRVGLVGIPVSDPDGNVLLIVKDH